MFFFFKQKTAYEMRISDWSSDVCSSDLARENYQVVLAFRDRLIRHGTVEACYLSLFGAEGVTVPPLFIDQMVHVICRNILDGLEDAMQLRADELLFRAQKVSIPDGPILLADEEIVEMFAAIGTTE